MKYLIVWILIFACIDVLAQKDAKDLTSKPMPAIELQVGYNKTTLIVFPFPIKIGDMGLSSVFAEVVKETNNVLRLKAAKLGFEPTNLNVITSDGSVYVFNVSYSENAPGLPIFVNKEWGVIPALFSGSRLNQNQYENIGRLVCQMSSVDKKNRSRNYGMRLHLAGIYLHEELLFFKYRLINHTLIGYSPGSIRFFIRDKNSLKRTAVQDSELLPEYIQVFGKPEDRDGQCIIAAFHKFVIADKKRFTVESMEEYGDRNLQLSIGQKKILKAKILK